MRKISVFFAIIGIITLTGCYDNREIDTLANVLAVGVEITDEGKKLYTFALGDTGGFGAESSGDGASLLCYGAYGKDMSEAVSAVDRKISKKLSFAHTSVILFSTKTAKEGITADTEFLEKDFKVRPQLMIALTDFSPSDYLNKLTPRLEPNADKYFQSIFNPTDAYVPSVKLSQFSNAYYCGYTVVAPIMSGRTNREKLTEEDAVVTKAGVMYRGRLASEIEDMSFVGLLYSRKNVKPGGVTLRSTARPKVRVGDFRTEIVFFTKSEENFDADEISKKAEEFFEEYSRQGLDVANTMYFARKNYAFYEDYQKFREKYKVKDMKYSVKVRNDSR